MSRLEGMEVEARQARAQEAEGSWITVRRL